jgi:CelD/BcsL family acetyltransferase involved in cellulose biosynthesis
MDMGAAVVSQSDARRCAEAAAAGVAEENDGLRAEVKTGASVLDDLGAEFDALARECRAPVTARRRWLQCWVRNYGEFTPVTVTVWTADSRLAGVGLFGVRRGLVGTRIVGLGHAHSDQSRLLARDIRAAGHLARAISQWLFTLRRPWHLTIAQLPLDDLTGNALLEVLPFAAARQGVGSPLVAFGEDRSLGRYISTNSRGQANNKWNRLIKANREPTIEVVTDPVVIAQYLPDLITIANLRLEQLTGRRKLDRSQHAQFFQDVILEHAHHGEAELLLLRIDGNIAAYSVTFIDGTVARMWSSHYHPAYAVFSPGHILAKVLVERCLETVDIDALDWMQGLEPYKFRSATSVLGTMNMHSWSSKSAWVIGCVAQRGYLRLAWLRARYPVIRRFQILLRRSLGGSVRTRWVK